MDRSSFDLLLYSARSSFGSLFAPSPFADHWSANLKSPFQRRTVAMDILKQAIPRLRTIEPDVIVIDLVDERFDLVANKFGRCTYSLELKAAGLRRSPQLTFVPSGGSSFMHHWEDGWFKFIETLDAQGLRDRVLINKSYWQYHTESGVPFDARMVDQANEMFDQMFAVQRKSLSSAQFIEYGNMRKCPDNHIWSPTPFHFDDESTLFSLKAVQDFVNRMKTTRPALA